MDGLLEFVEKILGDRTGKWRTSRNAQPKFWQRSHITHIAECLVENWGPRKNGRAGAGKISEDGSRCPVAAHNHRDTTRHQSCKQIAKSVRMRDRDHPEIQIVI